jgi:hypothetical protein
VSIGLGIFLGLVFCGFIYLYSKNRDTWNWVKCFKIIGVAGLAIIVTIGILIAGLVGYNKFESRPKVINEFKGIQLGDTYGDLVFKMGKVVKDTKNSERRQSDFPDTNDGIYDVPSTKAFAWVVRNRVDSIAYQCSEDSYDSTQVNGIYCGDSSEKISEKFGDNILVQCQLKDDSKIIDPFEHKVRMYEIKKFGVRYFLFENKVAAIDVFSSDGFKTLKSYGSCKN